MQASTTAASALPGRRPSAWPQILVWMLPLAILVALWWAVLRRAGGVGQAAMTFGRSRARLVADRAVGVSFDDVAGCEEAKTELREVV